MTQPPQPPNGPPQGGYGTPQSPQPGGYGTPQPPPAPPQGPPSTPPDFAKPPEQQGPGYGYPGPGAGQGTPPPPAAPPQTPPPPGQPPAQPPGQPAYGSPQGSPQDASVAQQPTVFAQPAVQPGQQQGYGYPGQQQNYGGYQSPTAPQAAVSPGKKVNSQLVIIVAAVVAIALIVGGGIWYSKSGSDDKKDEASSSSGGSGGSGGKEGKDGGSGGQGSGGAEKVPGNTSAKVLFQVPQPEVPKDAVYSVPGSWLYKKVFAKAGLNEIIGYDTDSGKQTWKMPLDGQTCGSAPEVTDDGITAVIYEEAKVKGAHDVQPCSKISAIDLNTGQKLWTKQVDNGDDKARFEEASISGNTVALGGDTDGGAAFDLKSGKLLWSPQAADTCKDDGYRGGEQLVAVRQCGDYDNPKLEVQLLDPSNGNPKWSYKLPAGIDNAKVISTKPVVFGVDSGEITASGVTDVFSLDDSGKLLTKITLPDGKYSHDCDVNHVHDCHGIIVGNNRVYVPTEQHQGGGEYGNTNEIVSFDLATGKSTGDRFDAGDQYTMFPVRMDGSNVLAYKDGPYDKGSQIVTINTKTSKQTTLLETPASQTVLDALMSMVPDSAEIWYADGRLFLGKELISKPLSADEKNYTVLGFAAD